MAADHAIDVLPRALVPRVLSLIGPADICNMWRTWWPSGYLGTKGFIADWCRYDEFEQKVPLIAAGRYNLIVTPRIAFTTGDVYQQWHAPVRTHDLAWVFDCDDDLFSPEFVDLQVSLSVLGIERDEAERQRQQRIHLIQKADGITVASPRLASVTRTFTGQTVRVQRNLINVEAFRYAMQTKERIVPPLTIGWSGTFRYDADLALVAQAWTAIAAKFPDVLFVVQGFESPALCAAVPAERLRVLPGVSPGDYPSILRNIDIFCCAVEDTVWNANKTPIKWMEATLAGAACVVSKALYGPFVSAATGLVASTTQEWIDALARLVERPSLRARFQAEAELVIVREHGLDAHWDEWVLTWSAILAERAKLRGERASHATREHAATS